MKLSNILISEVWGDVSPAALERGIGGREGAMVYLSREWAKLGHEVTNFVNIESGQRFYDGDGFHEYIPINMTKLMLSNFPWDAAIAWECPSAFDDPKVRENIGVKICEMQVAHFMGKEIVSAAQNCDYVAALSDWHGKFLLHSNLEMTHDKVITLPNGVDISRYPREEFDAKVSKKVDNDPKFVYSSSPDRGLWYLLQSWPYIREEFPEATLNVCYGTQKWIDMVKWSHGRIAEMATEIERLLVQPGVTDLGKIGQGLLSKLQIEADAWLYPFDPMSPTETGCFSGETLVSCPRDYKKYPFGIPIKEIEEGQLVWSYSEERKNFELKRVTKSWMTKKNAPVYKVTLDSGDIIRGTEEHPFLMRDGTWKALKDLQPRDSLMSLEFDFDPLVRVSHNGAMLPEYKHVATALGKISGDGLVSHHIDERRSNTSESNIEVITPSEHARRHNMTWDNVNKRMTERDASKRNERVRQFAKSRWDKIESKEERKLVFHKTHPELRCKRPCKACYSIWGYVPPMPEIKPGPGGKTARFNWEKKCAAEGIVNHKVVSIEFDGFEDVYNLEVEDNHTYVAGGVVVHNCITAIENAAAGNPIITTDADCMEEEFGEIGVIVDLPFDAQEYANVVSETLRDQDYIEYLRGRGREFAELRDWSKIAKKWLPYLSDQN